MRSSIEELTALQHGGRPVRLADLWPDLRMVVTWTCGSAGVTVRALREELTVHTRVFELGYVASEFRGTVTLGRRAGTGLPTIETHFFEFAERDQWDRGAPEYLTSPKEFEGHLARYCQVGFRDFKIKLAGDRARDLAKARSLQAAGIAPRSVRADANNLWSDASAAIDDLAALGFTFLALEEPLRAGDYAGMARIALALDCRIVLDESMARASQLTDLPGPAERWLVNLRVSKMGGLLRSLEFLEQARRQGVRAIVGAHVGETSVLTRAALTVASAAGHALVAQEGAFGTHLLEHDVVESPLMFGAGGILDAGAAGIGTAPGWGLAIRDAR